MRLWKVGKVFATTYGISATKRIQRFRDFASGLFLKHLWSKQMITARESALYMCSRILKIGKRKCKRGVVVHIK